MTRPVPDLILERYLLQELPESSARAVEHMLARDTALRERLEGLRQSDVEIRRNYAPHIAVHDKRAPSRRFVLGAAIAGGVLAVALIVAFVLPRPGATPTETDRVKGDIGAHPALAMYRRTPAGSERLADGDVARPGDLLRVGYTAAGRTYGVILSIDGRGAVTMHLPPRGEDAAPLSAEKMVLLDSAYELDAAPRIERFYFVTAAHPFKTDPVIAAAQASAGAPERLALPSDLDQVSFAVRKEERK